ncbi:MAG: DUF5107 domain-containing protein [Anaerolineae bacterium]|nr:DUF5107 domain-containing protein [Anaerolineae bacterium]
MNTLRHWKWLLVLVLIGLGAGPPVSTHPPPVAPVSFRVTSISIPTYPYSNYLIPVYSPTYNMTYRRLDWGAYRNSNPRPAPRTYQLLVLENPYLKVTLLPEVGGRVYQMIYKPTGNNELYQNPVLKPTGWGPSEQGWWLAAGGIEWCLPVDEHGYEWGEAWSWSAITSTAGVTVTLRDSTAPDRLRAAITVSLPADRACLAVSPRLENPTGHAIDYKYWSNAMLAPGPSNSVGPELRFVFNASEMAVHSTGDTRLPGHFPPTMPTGPDYRFSWPVYNGTDFSRLGNWRQWLGFFEYPQATGGFNAVYDDAVEEGVVRLFPTTVARGSKGFGFGWASPIDWRNWTDDGSTYVELHGGVAPTFWDTARIGAGQATAWTEYWCPLSGIAPPQAATLEAALSVREEDSGGVPYFAIGVHSTVPRTAVSTELYVWEPATCLELAHLKLPAVGPGAPFTAAVAAQGRRVGTTAFVYLDSAGKLLAALNPHDCLPPVSSIAPLPSWVGTESFTVTWGGRDTWSGIAAYDVQVRDGYEGNWSDWLTDTAAISATFVGAHGHTYFFRVRARDAFGNQGPYTDEEWGQAFTTVLTAPAAVLETSRKLAYPRLVSPGQPIAYTVLVSNTGNITAHVTLTDTCFPGLLPVSGTAHLPLTATLVTSASIVIRWSGQVAPGEAVRVSYILSPAQALLPGTMLTNTVEISGGIRGPVTRRAVVRVAHLVWLPVVLREM